MRNAIAATAVSLLLAACGAPAQVETATSVPQRDLTLSTSAAPSVRVASRIELPTIRVAHQPRAHRAAAAKTIREPEARPTPPAPAPKPESANPSPAPIAVPVAAMAGPSGRELAPGVTVSAIPVSNGPSTVAPGPTDWSEVPAARSHGGVMIGGGAGGRCGGGRGRGPVSILK